MTEPNLTDQNATPELTEDAAYSALATAMSKGDTAEIDRLMAVADAESDEDADGHNQANPPLDPKDSTSEDEEANKEAADKTAADDEQKPNAVNPDNDLEAMRAELHRLRSDVGRVSHLQRTVQELQRQARAHEARTPSTQVAESPPKAEPKTKELPDDLKKRIADLKEIDPELADTFEAFAKTMSQQTEARTSELQQSFEERQREQEEAQHWQEQKSELYKIVPRCDEIFAMPEWAEWKDSLTPGFRGLTESGYAQDMAQAIYAFASHMQARQQAYGNAHQATSSEGGDPNKNSNVADSNATNVNQEVKDTRARKIGAAADIRSTAAKKVEALDEEKMYSEFYQQIGRANHILPNK